MSEKIVDYQDMIVRIAKEDGKFRAPEVPVIPKPCRQETVDYISVSEWWKTQKARTVAEWE